MGLLGKDKKPKAEYSVDLSTLEGVTVTDEKGVTLPVTDLWKDQPVCIALLRQFGCLTCRRLAHVLTALVDEFKDQNVRLIAIGSGTPLMAQDFKDDINFGGEVFVDQSREVYKALQCHESVKRALGLKAISAIGQYVSDGYNQGATGGALFQLGGVYIFHKDQVLFAHRERFSGDHPDANDLIRAVYKQTA